MLRLQICGSANIIVMQEPSNQHQAPLLLDKLPLEIIFYILTYLDIVSLMRLASCSSLLNRLSQNDIVWAYLRKRDFPNSTAGNHSDKSRYQTLFFIRKKLPLQIKLNELNCLQRKLHLLVTLPTITRQTRTGTIFLSFVQKFPPAAFCLNEFTSLHLDYLTNDQRREWRLQTHELLNKAIKIWKYSTLEENLRPTIEMTIRNCLQTKLKLIYYTPRVMNILSSTHPNQFLHLLHELSHNHLEPTSSSDFLKFSQIADQRWIKFCYQMNFSSLLTRLQETLETLARVDFKIIEENVIEYNSENHTLALSFNHRKI